MTRSLRFPALPSLAVSLLLSLLLLAAGCDGSNAAPCDLACENGGACAVIGGEATCECASGYESSLCETESDECASDPCASVGHCVDEVDGYTCIPHEISIWGDDLTASNMMGPMVEGFGLSATDYPGTLPETLETAIADDHVAYSAVDYAIGTADLHLFRISTGERTRVTATPGAPVELRGHGDHFAWIENVSGVSTVFTYQISTGQLLARTSVSDEPDFLAIEGDLLVWMDGTGPNSGIYGIVLSTGASFTIRQTTDQLASPLNLHEHVLAYRNFDSGSSVEATVLSSTTPGTVDREIVQLSVGLGSCHSPAPSAEGILFRQGLGSAGVDIYYYDLATDMAYDLTGSASVNHFAPVWAGTTPIWTNSANGGELLTYDLSLLGDMGDPGAQVTTVNGVSLVYRYTDTQVLARDSALAFRVVTVGTWAEEALTSPVGTNILSVDSHEAGIAYRPSTSVQVSEAFYWTGGPAIDDASQILAGLNDAFEAGEVLVLGETSESRAAIVLYQGWDTNGGGPGLYFFGGDTNESNVTVDFSDNDVVPYDYDGTTCAARHIVPAAGQEGHPIFAGLDTTAPLDLATSARTTTEGLMFTARAMPEGPPDGWTVLATWAPGDCFDGTPNAPAIVEYRTASGAPVILDGAANQETAYADWSDTRKTLLHNQLLYLAQ